MNKGGYKNGYYGEQLVLKAQELGLNTCWVAMTHGKSAAKVSKGEKLAIVISLGYGANQGVAHQSKKLSSVCNQSENIPEWFAKGMEQSFHKAKLIARRSYCSRGFHRIKNFFHRGFQ